MNEHFVERREDWNRVTVLEERMNQLASKVDVQEHVSKLDKRMERLEGTLSNLAEGMKGSWESLRGEVSNLAAMFAKQTERAAAINEEAMKREGQHQQEIYRLEIEKRDAENAKLLQAVEDAKPINRIKNMGAPVVMFIGALAGLAAILWTYFQFAVQQAVQHAKP